MQKNVIIIAVLLLISFYIYYFSSNTYKTSNQPAQPVQVAQTDATLTPTTEVSNATKTKVESKSAVIIKNFSFNPSSVTVKIGTKVTWVNNDSVPHTITFDSKTLSGSAAIYPGQSFDFTFTDAGSVNYHCNFHPGMRGNITVEK